VALVVEGGAMRGVISAGMVSALEVLGFAGAFDRVYGSSAGAINAAYFLAGQARIGTSIYYEDINNRRFIDLRRALQGRAIVNLEFLLGDVAVRRKQLDVDRVLRSRSPLSVMATDVESEASVPLAAFENAEQLFGALRAGATMPVVAGDPHLYRGRRYLDASLTQPIPVLTAESDGHTHVVVLLTRDGGMESRPSAFDRYFVGPRLRRLSPGLADRYLTRAGPYAQLIHLIGSGKGPLGRADVLGVSVPGLRISKLERRADVLRTGAQLGYDAIMRTLGPDAG
jgi:predicted patatin/cPLA2 family phospholipase